jgi:membrane-associated phospholipid phosphatase
MLRDRSAEDALVSRMIGKGSRKGSTWFGRAGDIIQCPPAWAGLAALISATGRNGRRAALRGSACYLSTALAHLPIKAIVGRRHPPGAALRQLGPFTSSFPSGHAASDLAFVLGASQERPLLFFPLSAATMAVHWSLVRKRAHYPTDVLVGGALGIAVAAAAWKLWPPQRRAEENIPGSQATPEDGPAGGSARSEVTSVGEERARADGEALGGESAGGPTSNAFDMRGPQERLS